MTYAPRRIMRLVLGSQTDVLLDALVEVLEEPLSSPLVPEHIVVSSIEVRRWLEQRLCQRLGVLSNTRFWFPREFALELLQRASPAPPAEMDPHDPAVSRWTIAATLPGLCARAGFEPVARYLEHDEGGRKCRQLAARLADCFDQYEAFRPELTAQWRAGEDEAWDAQLHREVFADAPVHFSRRLVDLANGLRDEARIPLPERLSVFLPSPLPTAYLDLFRAIGQHVPVRVFAHALSPATSREDAHPLEASLGELGLGVRAALVASADADRLEWRVGATTMTTALGRLQADIRAARALPALEDRPRFDATAPGLHVVSTHGPMREVEVLHEHLLALLDAEPPVRPSEVLVLVPDLERYAGLIDTVFGHRPKGAPRIPYSIGARRTAALSPVLRSVDALLTALGGRFEASTVVDLLQLSPLRAAAGLTPADVDLVREWVREAGIRWGVDEAHRAEAGQPRLRQNTWEFGLDRLLLGVAMEPIDDRLWPPQPDEGVLAYGEMEGAETETLGRFAVWFDTLRSARETTRTARSLADWRPVITGVLDRLLGERAARAFEHRLLRDGLTELFEPVERAGYATPIELDDVRRLVLDMFDGQRAGGGFMEGGVSFAELVPFRPLPFEVVCILGLDDESFPRESRPPAFDRIGVDLRPSDRTPRRDDRQAFLEAVSSARRHLHLSFTGRSIRDDKKAPPSVVLAELLDAIADGFSPPPDRTPPSAGSSPDDWVREQLVREHPLQPFSPRYFAREEPELFSYEARYCAAARAGIDDQRREPPFVDRVVPSVRTQADAEPVVLPLDELARFLKRPNERFLRAALELTLAKSEAPLQDRETLKPDGLQGWSVGDAVLRAVLAGASPEDTWPRIRAKGVLGIGRAGERSFDPMAELAADIAKQAGSRLAGGHRAPRPIALELGGVRLTGSLRHFTDAGLVRAEYRRLGGDVELAFWLEHLAAAADGTPAPSYLYGQKNKKAAVVQFSPVATEEARSRLETLVELWRLGQRAPVPLFPSISRAYAETLITDGEAAKAAALDEARKKYTDERTYDGARDAAVALAFRGVDPFDPDCRSADHALAGFASAARAVFEPLLRAQGLRTKK